MKFAPLLLFFLSLALGPSHGAMLRPASFTFFGVTNRILTPNGDMKNDQVFFNFVNPAAADVTGKIFDVKGRTVVGFLPTAAPIPPSTERLFWDGKANGQAVPGGIYIYVIQAEGKTFSGTVVVIR